MVGHGPVIAFGLYFKIRRGSGVRHPTGTLVISLELINSAN